MKTSHVLIALTSLVLTCAAQLQNVAAQPAAEMGQMQARMQEMQALMERIRNTSDPAERQRLMDEHMRAMHDGMAMMGRMGGQGGPGPGAECSQHDSECRMREMQREQRMMGERMGMMQMMMQQMMDQMMMRGSEDDRATAPERRQGRADRQPRETK
jgi:hypothetical protein